MTDKKKEEGCGQQGLAWLDRRVGKFAPIRVCFPPGTEEGRKLSSMGMQPKGKGPTPV